MDTYTCKCGAVISMKSKDRHEKSSFFHIKFMEGFAKKQEIKNIIENKETIMPPKKVVKKVNPNQNVSLEIVLKKMKELPNPQTTISIWYNNIINLVNFSLEERIKDKKEVVAEQLKDFNVFELLMDFDKVANIIKNKIVNTTNNQPIAEETKKQYWFGILSVIGENGSIQLPEDIVKKYTQAKTDAEIISQQSRKYLVPKGIRISNPDVFWDDIVEKYEKFLKDTPFTNTEKGRRELRYAIAIGLYVLQAPRRVNDYSNLKWYSKLPSEKVRQDNNIIVINGDNATFYIDDFKIRHTTKKGKKKEVLPTYIKEVNATLLDLIKKHIKFNQIPDMTKEKEDHFIFFKENGTKDGIDPGYMSKLVKTAGKYIFQLDITATDYRHLYSHYINVKHPNEFNIKHLDQIAIDVGDKHRSTQYAYRDANLQNINKTPAEIQEALKEKDRRADEQDSVGNVPQQEQNEVINEVVDTDKEVIIQNLFKAMRPFLMKLL